MLKIPPFRNGQVECMITVPFTINDIQNLPPSHVCMCDSSTHHINVHSSLCRAMTDLDNNASVCVVAPAGAQAVMKMASNMFTSDSGGAVNTIVSSLPDASSVKEYLNDVLNGTVDICFETNATKWCVRRLEHTTTTTTSVEMNNDVVHLVAPDVKAEVGKHVIDMMAADARMKAAEEQLQKTKVSAEEHRLKEEQASRARRMAAEKKRMEDEDKARATKMEADLRRMANDEMTRMTRVCIRENERMAIHRWPTTSVSQQENYTLCRTIREAAYTLSSEMRSITYVPSTP